MDTTLPTQTRRLAAKLGLVIAALLPLAVAHAQHLPGAPGQPDMTIDAATRDRVADALVRELNAGYVFPAQAKQADTALRTHRKHGDYATLGSAQAYADALTRDLQQVTHDRHLRVFYSAETQPDMPADAKPSAEEQAVELADLKAHNFGVERVERLPFNIGYLDLRGFVPSRYAAESLAATMTLLGNTQALIIDLRRNGGGDPNTVALLASYFLDERTRLNDIYYRAGDRTEQMWSTDAVAGTRYGQAKDVYILTSKHTFSAAEDFSYAMKNLKRATIVGETTGGGAHPGDVKRLDAHFAVFVPNGRSISQVTGTDWEGTGVTPDVAVAAEDAHKAAQLAILRKLLASAQPGRKADSLRDRIVAVEGENTAGTMDR